MSRDTIFNGRTLPLASMPLKRSICWRPVGDSYYLLAAVLGDRLTHHPLFITQAALREVDEQWQAIEEDAPVFGLLGGVLARSPKPGIIYPTVTRVVPIPWLEQGEAGRHAFHDVMVRADTHLAACGEEILGWYRSRPHVGRRLLPGDERFMLEHFPEHWQATLVFSPDGHGSFFRYKAEAERSFGIPFYELMEEEMPVAVEHSAVPFSGYEPAPRAVYPETGAVALEEALRIESEEELGPLGRRFLKQLRSAILGEDSKAGNGKGETGNGRETTENRNWQE